jgi:hypothetical protein
MFDSHAGDDSSNLGNPEIEGYLAVCKKEDKQRATRYQQLLEEPYRCGSLLSKAPLPRRDSSEYRTRFEQATRQIYRETSADHAGVRGMCEFFMLSCVSHNPTLTDQEKQRHLEMLLRQE